MQTNLNGKAQEDPTNICLLLLPLLSDHQLYLSPFSIAVLQSHQPPCKHSTIGAPILLRHRSHSSFLFLIFLACYTRRPAWQEAVEFSPKSPRMKDEEGRVSICILPKNALLLMRCRSDPVKMAALANRFWESPAAPIRVVCADSVQVEADEVVG